MAKQLSGAEATRTSLVAAALRLFGDYGYDAVSTRQIADQAAANIGSIAYHFGGKQGLRVACVDYVIGAVMDTLGAPLTQTLPADVAPDDALKMLEQMFANLVRLGAQRPDSEEISTFIMREMVMPGDLVEHIYSGMVRPLHERVERLFMIATGIAESSQSVKLTIFTLMGQTMFFRLCKPALMRRLNWSHIGDAEIAAQSDAIIANLRGVVNYHRAEAERSTRTHAPIALVG